MKFNERLIELRKKEGLSQEELGYKLNVTRQTVSKWELGQTTPELDKLVEISRIFNISVDELINNSEETNNIIRDETMRIDDEPIVDSENRHKEKSVKAIIMIALVGVIVLIIIKVVINFTLPLFNVTKTQQNFFERIFSMIEDIFNETKEQKDNINDFNTEIDMSNFSKETSEESTFLFNRYLNNYNGTQRGFFVRKCLDEVITSNKTKERKITVRYNEIETQDADEIKDLKKSLVDEKQYEVSYDYDEGGFINKVTIEDL